MRLKGILAATLALLFALSAQAAAQSDAPASSCLAIARAVPDTHFVSLSTASLERNEVRITFLGHASFHIESPGGVSVVTDYAGYLPPDIRPDVATMNRAHRSHYTDTPDPAIAHVLRGWSTDGTPARHHFEIRDMLIRNVPTDIRSWGGGRIPAGNSIFIFEVAGMCIGHLGHLHHELGPDRIAQIGRLDVVMVPVDGSFTMAQPAMVKVLRELRARLVLPMHYFGPDTLNRFLAQMRDDFAIEISPVPQTVVSLATLPRDPTVRVLPGY